MVDGATYDNLEFLVQKGDLLFLYSDGLIETRDEHSKIRDSDFFEQIIHQLIKKPYKSLAELSQMIFKEVQKTDHSDRFEDDATLIIIEV